MDDRRDCCQDETNLGAPVDEGNGLVVQTCTVCGAQHFVLTLDPVDVLADTQPLG